MKLSDLNKLFFFLIIFISFSNLHAEDEIDIWKNNSSNDLGEEVENKENKIQSPLINKNSVTTNNIIQEQTSSEVNNTLLYGIWDPDRYNFELSMWSRTDGKNIQKTISRINTLDLSETAENILLNTLFSYSYAPENLSEKDFLDIKINWLIKNKKDDLIEQFLTKNKLSSNKVVDQAFFLKRLGIIERAEILSKGKSFQEKSDLYYRLERLIGEKKMGKLFKVIFATDKKTKFDLGFK